MTASKRARYYATAAALGPVWLVIIVLAASVPFTWTALSTRDVLGLGDGAAALSLTIVLVAAAFRRAIVGAGPIGIALLTAALPLVGALVLMVIVVIYRRVSHQAPRTWNELADMVSATSLAAARFVFVQKFYVVLPATWLSVMALRRAARESPAPATTKGN